MVVHAGWLMFRPVADLVCRCAECQGSCRLLGFPREAMQGVAGSGSLQATPAVGGYTKLKEKGTQQCGPQEVRDASTPELAESSRR